jgi:DNA-directed RNA polymerase subunit M/transcription elongation factor TFIIS
MSKLGTLVRTCPSCGHRFHVKFTNERVLSDKKTTEPVSKDGMMINTGPSTGVWGTPRGKVWSPPMGAQERGTFTTTRKEFEDSFKCERCGHQWSEKRIEENEAS